MINKITLVNGAKIIDNKYVRKIKKSDVRNIYSYLSSRSFNYYPEITKEDDNYIYYEYVSDIDEPAEEKLSDLILLVSLLHSKTSFYKEIDIEENKYMYEEISKNILDITNYYDNLINNIDNQVYMSPANYLIARNISIIYRSLTLAKSDIDKWYKLVAESRKKRVAMTHNNLSVEHYLKSDKPYLISWDKAKIDMPLMDLVSLYKKHYLDYDFLDLFKLYFSKYPYTEDEMLLLMGILSIPSKIKNMDSEYAMVRQVRRLIDYLYKTEDLLKKYRIKQETKESDEETKKN